MKLRGSARRQLRKLKSPSGCLFGLVGAGLGIAWIASMLAWKNVSPAAATSPEIVRNWTQVAMGIFALLTIVSAVSVRGVYLPKQDIERLFAAPVSRSDLVRYRMIVDLARSLFGALMLGLLTFQRMPNPVFGFLGAMTAIMTLGIVRQGLSLLLGGAESRLGNLLRRRSLTSLRVILGLLVWLLVMAVIFGGRITDPLLGNLSLEFSGEDLFKNPVLQALLLPMRPWAEMMAATTVTEFLAWGAACMVLGVILFEVTARLPIDYRENSLETSEAIAKRLSQVRRGNFFTGGKPSEHTVGWRIPHLFGRGPVGAVAWVKFISVLRKARGTLAAGVFIVALVTIGVSVLAGKVNEEESLEMALGSSCLICFLGITYLAGILRFDFRSDLDRMVQIKAWPASNVRIFVGTLLPLVLLISGLLSIAIILRMLILDQFVPAVLLVPIALPFITFAWLAIDNAVFLFAPVRFVPGQEGGLHHTGRTLVLFFLRILLIGTTACVVALTAAGILYVGSEYLAASMESSAWVAAAFAFCVLLLLDGLLAWIGGRMLKRFDVARDSR
ncbi:MAG: ABC-type multidrug transport system fused ATPase/permease subunit [Planctomycetota bacterium]|jgi:ABC-type multidrug transport system fused ATPase/permease subunit